MQQTYGFLLHHPSLAPSHPQDRSTQTGDTWSQYGSTLGTRWAPVRIHTGDTGPKYGSTLGTRWAPVQIRTGDEVGPSTDPHWEYRSALHGDEVGPSTDRTGDEVGPSVDLHWGHWVAVRIHTGD